LTKTEVEKLCSNSILEESTSFGKNEFRYILRSKDDASELTAKFENETMTVFIPAAFIKDWSTNDVVGFNSSNNSPLHILVEKDFKCLDETTEDQSDNFENPHVTCQE
jgi:hypothetical protein